MEKKKWTPKQIEAWNKTREKGVKNYQAKLKQKKPVFKNTSQAPIAKRSKKRAKQERKYNKLVANLKMLPENEICQWPGCEAPATDCHHPEGRVGDKLLQSDIFKFLCRAHHIYAEMNPEEAKEKGISGNRIDKVK